MDSGLTSRAALCGWRSPVASARGHRGHCQRSHGLRALTRLSLLPDILNELFQRENRVLHYWTMRKRRLDQCQQYVVFERSAKQVSRDPPRRRPPLRPARPVGGLPAAAVPEARSTGQDSRAF